MRLTHKDFMEVALQENLGLAELKAIKEVESRGDGHLADGRPKILFEGHKFYQHLAPNPKLRAQVMKERPDLCFPKWTKQFYKGGAAEWDRLEAAIKYAREAALKSASWGAFQIMGENFAAAGFASVQEMVNAMYQSEREHLVAVCNFIKAHPRMHKALVGRNWGLFAMYYNGPKFEENQYHTQLDKAYSRFAKQLESQNA